MWVVTIINWIWHEIKQKSQTIGKNKQKKKTNTHISFR